MPAPTPLTMLCASGALTSLPDSEGGSPAALMTGAEALAEARAEILAGRLDEALIWIERAIPSAAGLPQLVAAGPSPMLDDKLVWFERHVPALDGLARLIARSR